MDSKPSLASGSRRRLVAEIIAVVVALLSGYGARARLDGARPFVATPAPLVAPAPLVVPAREAGITATYSREHRALVLQAHDEQSAETLRILANKLTDNWHPTYVMHPPDPADTFIRCPLKDVPKPKEMP